MGSPRRRLAALVIAPLLVVGLAACAGAEPAAQPTLTLTPTPTPIPTETAAEVSVPTSRVPVTCDELFSSSLVSGGVATPYLSPMVEQAGYLGCRYEGLLDGKSAYLVLDISVDPPIDELNRILSEPFDGTSFSCADDENVGNCRENIVVGSYAVTLSVFDFASSGAGSLTPLFASFLAEVKQRVSSWPAPEPAWQPPADALRWAFDCAEVIARQDVVRDVVPFPLGDAQGVGQEINLMNQYAMAETGTTWCTWFEDGNVDVMIVPGGAWIHDTRPPLEGEPYALEGALAATRTVGPYGDHTLSAYISGSFVEVTVGPPPGVDGAAVAEAVMVAIVAAF